VEHVVVMFTHQASHLIHNLSPNFPGTRLHFTF
jgi:hypothetical protein